MQRHFNRSRTVTVEHKFIAETHVGRIGRRIAFVSNDVEIEPPLGVPVHTIRCPVDFSMVLVK